MAFVLYSVKYNIMPKKILIVEENVLMAEIMTNILNNIGYDVIPLYNGYEVFTHIKTDQPDLVILDIMLPGIDNEDVCSLIKLNSETRNLPIIICSGNEDIDEFITHTGAPDDILYKPFDITALVQKVQFQLAA